MNIEELQKEILDLEQTKKDLLKNIEDTKEKIKQAIDSNDFELVTKLTNKLKEYSNSIQTIDEKITKLNNEIEQNKINQENQEKIVELKREAKEAIDLGNYEAIERITKKITEYESPTKTTGKEDETTDKKESVYHYNEKKEEYRKKYFENCKLYDFSPDVEEFIEKHGSEFDNVYLFPPRFFGGKTGKKEETFIKRYNDDHYKPILMIKGKNFSILCSNYYRDNCIQEFGFTFIGKKCAYEVKLNSSLQNGILWYVNNETADKYLKEYNDKKKEPEIDKNEFNNRIVYGYGSDMWTAFHGSIEIFDELGLTTLVGDQKQFKNMEEIYNILNSPEFETRLEAVYNKISSKDPSVVR